MKDWKTMLKVMISAGIKREENSTGSLISNQREQIFFGGRPYMVRQITQKMGKKAGGRR
jgi:hypothetical protein